MVIQIIMKAFEVLVNILRFYSKYLNANTKYILSWTLKYKYSCIWPQACSEVATELYEYRLIVNTCSIPYMVKHSREKTFMFTVGNGYSLDNFCSSMLIDLYCQLKRAWFIGKDSRLSENLWKARKFSPSNVLPYTVAV